VQRVRAAAFSNETKEEPGLKERFLLCQRHVGDLNVGVLDVDVVGASVKWTKSKECEECRELRRKVGPSPPSRSSEKRIYETEDDKEGPS
jgi:hypothetical protein